MNKIFIAILVLGTLCCLFSQTKTVDISNGLATLKELNNHSIKMQVLNELYNLENQVNNRMLGEFNIGVGHSTEFKNIGVIQVMATPINGKIARFREAQSRVYKISKLLELTNDEFSAKIIKKLASIEKEIEEYKWKRWLRFGVGVCFPFEFNSNDPYNNFNIDYTGEIGYFLAYDISDYVTLSFGSTLDKDNSFFTSISLDLSTPVYYLASYFLSSMNKRFNAGAITTTNPYMGQ